jgi:hypothetical protein
MFVAETAPLPRYSVDQMLRIAEKARLRAALAKGEGYVAYAQEETRYVARLYQHIRTAQRQMRKEA